MSGAADAFASRLTLLWGWPRVMVAVLAGALSALAMPPVSFPLILFVTFPILVWLIDGALDAGKTRVRRFWPAFVVGWAFGFGYFLAGLYWVGFAFLVDGDLFGWMLPFAVMLLPAGLAVFYGLAAGVARLIWSEGTGRIAALAATLAAAEWLRGHSLSGFPWNTLGYALTADDRFMQSASVFGIYGLTVLTVLIFASPAALVGKRATWIPVTLSLIALMALFGFGVLRLSETRTAAEDGVRLRLVQPNIAQDQKWLPANRGRIFSDYLALSDRPSGSESPGLRPGTVVIWPESATPFLLSREPGALAQIADVLPPGSMLFTGSNRLEESGNGRRAIYNSVYQIDDLGGIVGRYDKVRLVPFGEMLPFERTLNALGIRRLVTLPGTFAAGRRPQVLGGGLIPSVRPLICYEIIFSGSVIGDTRPAWILNVTNDAWFGNSSGPRQHLHFSRVRAVEEGLPVVRAANTGISAIIDAKGRIRASLPLNGKGVLDGRLPAALPPTLFSRFGSILFVVLLGLTALVAVAAHRQKTSVPHH